MYCERCSVHNRSEGRCCQSCGAPLEAKTKALNWKNHTVRSPLEVAHQESTAVEGRLGRTQFTALKHRAMQLVRKNTDEIMGIFGMILFISCTAMLLSDLGSSSGSALPIPDECIINVYVDYDRYGQAVDEDEEVDEACVRSHATEAAQRRLLLTPTVDEATSTARFTLPAHGQCPSEHPIKGNLTTSSGEKIYHVPGGQFYDRTIPEECFATEADARAAGYRRSQR